MANGSLIAPFWINWRFFFNIFMIMSYKSPANRTTGSEWVSVSWWGDIAGIVYSNYNTLKALLFHWISFVMAYQLQPFGTETLVLMEMVQNHLENSLFFYWNGIAIYLSLISTWSHLQRHMTEDRNRATWQWLKDWGSVRSQWAINSG